MTNIINGCNDIIKNYNEAITLLSVIEKKVESNEVLHEINEVKERLHQIYESVGILR